MAWGSDSSHADELTPAALNRVAESCEALEPGEQRAGFAEVMKLLYDIDLTPSATSDQNIRRIAQLAEAGAFESAALAMMPANATFTGGRLGEGSCIAQVVLPGGAGAHSRNARSLSMAWLAALLRANARQLIETKALPLS